MRARLGLLAIAATLFACRSPGPVERAGLPEPRASIPAAPAGTAPGATAAASDAAGADAEGGPGDGGLGPLVAAPFETWRTGELETVASLPVGARERRPVVVGVHGSHDRPDATCARWRRALGGWPFIVCPRGVPYRGALAWGSAGVVAERIDAALAALRERHGAHLADGPVVYAGWSLGATRGPEVVALRPGVFGLVVLAEVGHTRIDSTSSAKALRLGRTPRVLVACATRRCAK